MTSSHFRENFVRAASDYSRAIVILDDIHHPDIARIHPPGEVEIFALEPGASLFAFYELRREDLDGDPAIELRVFGQIDFAHPAFADLL